MTQITIKNAETTFLALQKSSQELAEQCNLLTVTDELSEKIATQNLREINDKIKSIEEIRVKEKAPYFDAGKQIDALAKKLSIPLEESLSGGKKKILAYNQEKQRVALIEQNRINAIKGAMSKYTLEASGYIKDASTMEELTIVRNQWVVDFPTELWKEFSEDAANIKALLNDLCKNKRIEITTPKELDDTVSETIADIIEEKVAEIGLVEIKAAEHVSSSKITGTWKFEVTDLTQVPRSWMEVDDSKVKAFIKEHKENLVDGATLSGVKFYLEETVKIR